jgi:hypothetical protein
VLNHAFIGWRNQTRSSQTEMRVRDGRIRRESCMRFMAPFMGIALSLAGLTFVALSAGSLTTQRYGSWQELSAAQPTCSSMTNLTSASSSGVENLKCLVLVPCAHNDWICADRQ